MDVNPYVQTAWKFPEHPQQRHSLHGILFESVQLCHNRKPRLRYAQKREEIAQSIRDVLNHLLELHQAQTEAAEKDDLRAIKRLTRQIDSAMAAERWH